MTCRGDLQCGALKDDAIWLSTLSNTTYPNAVHQVKKNNWNDVRGFCLRGKHKCACWKQPNVRTPFWQRSASVLSLLPELSREQRGAQGSGLWQTSLFCRPWLRGGSALHHPVGQAGFLPPSSQPTPGRDTKRPNGGTARRPLGTWRRQTAAWRKKTQD